MHRRAFSARNDPFCRNTTNRESYSRIDARRFHLTLFRRFGELLQTKWKPVYDTAFVFVDDGWNNYDVPPGPSSWCCRRTMFERKSEVHSSNFILEIANTAEKMMIGEKQKNGQYR